MQTNAKNKEHITLSFIIWIAILLNISVVHGQNALKKGEYLPEMTIKNVYNVKGHDINLSKGKTKLILFDFWSPNCTACLMSFPKLDSLQRLFNDDISIILVNQQSLDSTKIFFNQRKFLYKPNLPFVTSDTLLNCLFPNLGNPAYAWLDGEGKFYQMSNNITADGIRSFISQQKTGLENYRAKRTYLPSLFDPEFDNNLMSYSYLSKAIPGVNLSGAVGMKGITSSNYTILDLYRRAYGEQGKYNFKKIWKIELIVKDNSRFIIPDNIDLAYKWKKEHLYTYALLLPQEKAKERFHVMQNDLDRYFGLTSNVEKRLVKSMTLVRTSTKDKLKSKKELKSKSVDLSGFFMSDLHTSKITSKRVLTDCPYLMFSNIFKAWVELRLQKPFIDQTGYAGNIDISMNGAVVDRFDLAEIRKALKAYDLDLVEEECMIDVLILREENNSGL